MVLKLIKLQNKMTAFHGQEGMQQISANQIRLLLWRLDLDRKVKTPNRRHRNVASCCGTSGLGLIGLYRSPYDVSKSAASLLGRVGKAGERWMEVARLLSLK